MIRLLAAALFCATPSAAAVLEVEPHVFHDGTTLVDLADEGLDLDTYDPWAGAKVRWTPASEPGLPYVLTAALPCRAGEYDRRENFDICGHPARALPPVEAWLHLPPPASVGGGCDDCGRPKPPNPVPVPAAGWLILAAMAALVLKRRLA